MVCHCLQIPVHKLIVILVAIAVIYSTLIMSMTKQKGTQSLTRGDNGGTQHGHLVRKSMDPIRNEILPIHAVSIDDVSPCYLYSKKGEQPKDTKKQIKLGCKRRLPDAIIIGVKKCGTYTLQNFLDIHPQLEATAGAKFQTGGLSVEESSLAWRQLMPLTTPFQKTVADFPGFIDRVTLLGHIERNITEAKGLKIIVILRDPVKRAISDYVHVSNIVAHNDPSTSKHVRYRYEMITDNRGVQIEMKNITVFKRHYELLGNFENTIKTKEGSLNERHPLIKKGIYLKYIQDLFRVIDKRKVLILDGDKFKTDPVSVLRKVEKFMGLSRFFLGEHFRYEEDKGFYCPDIPERPDRYCMGARKGRKHPAISNRTLEELYSFYKPYNNRLAKFLNQTFAWIE